MGPGLFDPTWDGRGNEKRIGMRYLGLGVLLIFLLLIPCLAYWFGQDSREGIESDDFQRRRARGA